MSPKQQGSSPVAVIFISVWTFLLEMDVISAATSVNVVELPLAKYLNSKSGRI